MKKLVLLLAVVQLSCAFSVGNPHNTTAQPTKPATIVPVAIPQGKLYVVTGDVYVRSCPDLSCPVVDLLRQGQVVAAECGGGSFCRVDSGYVSEACLVEGGKCVGK